MLICNLLTRAVEIGSELVAELEGEGEGVLKPERLRFSSFASKGLITKFVFIG